MQSNIEEAVRCMRSGPAAQETTTVEQNHQTGGIPKRRGLKTTGSHCVTELTLEGHIQRARRRGNNLEVLRVTTKKCCDVFREARGRVTIIQELIVMVDQQRSGVISRRGPSQSINVASSKAVSKIIA